MASRRDRTWTQVGEGTIDLSFPTIFLLYDAETGAALEPGRVLGAVPFVIGRSAEVTGYSLDDPRVSRQHAVVKIRSGGQLVILEDLSRNGTFVNGARIDGEAELRDGDVLRVGNSFLLLRRMPEETQDAEVPSIVGRAPSIGHLRRAVSIVAPTDATALVVGASGTGKELVARAIHDLSGRTGPFVPVNCSAIPSTLAESQLFGHVAGSFTGARDHEGYFRAAHGGTLFLDEVGELPADVQPKLLRVLEDHEVTPVGASSPISVDVRVVAATNRDLESAVDEGRFRGDVFARLAEIVVQTPDLSDRREDVLTLFRLGFGAELPTMAPDLVEALLLNEWRFNVRELFKVAKELRIKGAGAERLELRLVDHRLSPVADAGPRAADRRDASEAPQRTERPPAPSRAVLEAMLRECEGNVSKLGRLLGRSRRQVYRYLEEHGLDAEAYRT